jgi:hypothetical protein
VKLSLVEDAASKGKVVVRGEFARADKGTENKRVYPAAIWEREFKRLGKAISERKLLGELDHPGDGRTMLARSSHLVTGLSLEDGIVVGEAEVLDTNKGKDLKALFQANVKVGVSSRGYGSTKTNEEGLEVVQEDYQLGTFDFVAEPADSNAYPEVFSESRERSMGGTTSDEQLADEKAKSEEWARRIEAARNEGAETAKATLRDQLIAELEAKIGAERAAIKDEAKAELLADPSVAGAKRVLDQLKTALRPYVLPEDAEMVLKSKDAEIARLQNEVSQRDLKIASLEEENVQVAQLAKEAGYKFFLERTIGAHPDKELIRKLIGDVKAFDSAAALKTKVESVISDLDSKRAQMKRVQEERAKEKAKAAELEESAAKGKTQLQEGLKKSLELNKALGLQLYAQKRLTNHPHAGALRPIIESMTFGSEEEVDKVVDNFRAPTRTPETMETTRARVRRLTMGGSSTTPLEEETPSAAMEEHREYNGTGLDLRSLRELAGMSRDRSSVNGSGNNQG